LVVDQSARQNLLAAGIPSDRLTPDSALRAAPAGGTSWRAADYVLSTADVRAAASGQLGTVLRSSVLVASFGDGDDRVEVREVAPDGVAAASARARRIAAVSADLGRQLMTSRAVS